VVGCAASQAGNYAMRKGEGEPQPWGLDRSQGVELPAGSTSCTRPMIIDYAALPHTAITSPEKSDGSLRRSTEAMPNRVPQPVHRMGN
jgi:hypothetical protein